MKPETKLTLLFFIGLAIGLAFVCHITPTASQQEEIDFKIRMDDTTLINHSEIQVQEWSESGMWYRMVEQYERGK